MNIKKLIVLSSYFKYSNRANKEKVLEQLKLLEKPSKLIFIPELVGILKSEISIPELHKILIELYKGGVIELRPESGMGRLSKEEMSFALPGPQGNRLSWARFLEEPKVETGSDLAFEAGFEQGEADGATDKPANSEEAYQDFLEYMAEIDEEPSWIKNRKAFEAGYEKGYTAALKAKG